MKTLVVALVTATMMAGQFFTPVAAASLSTQPASTACGDTYVVQHNDNLSSIAIKCGTTVSSILGLNPTITNPNLIYTGQTLRLTSSSSTTTGSTSSSGATTSSGSLKVSLSTTQAKEGDAITVTISGFPANSNIDYRVGEQGKTYTIAYDGATDSNGADSQTITLPTAADTGEYWVVQVTTTERSPVVSLTSHTIYISTESSSSSTTYPYAQVSLSTTQAGSGDSVTVTVSGFPANANIDYRVGKQNENYSVAYDGTTDSNGHASKTITMPSNANSGQYWVVNVTTTDRSPAVAVTSHTIYMYK